MSLENLLFNNYNRYETQLKRFCQPFLEKMQFSFFAHEICYDSGETFMMSTRLDCAEKYLFREFYLDDPYISSSQDTLLPVILWQDSTKNCERENDFSSLFNEFQLHNGIRILKKIPKGRETYSFSTPVKGSSITNKIISSLPLIYKFIDYYEDEMLAIRADSENFVYIPGLNKSKTTGMESHSELEELNKLLIRKQSKYTQSQTITLSQTEYNCLNLYRKLFSTREVSDVMCLSVRTVESHIYHLKKKFDVRTNIELITQFTEWQRLGLLTFK